VKLEVRRRVFPRFPAVAARLLGPAGGKLAGLVRANRLFALALGAGGFLRLLAMIGYPGVLWFPGDSFVYLGAALRLRPDLSKTTGYSFFLRALEPFHSLILVGLVQHLMGLAIAVMVYALLRRAGVSLRWSALATLPILLDGFEIELEHMVMAETLFTFLVMVAVTLLLWPERPSWLAGLVAGLLTGYAIIVRTEGLPLPVLLVGFLLVRRKGWRPVLTTAAGCALPVIAYAAWFHSYTGEYALTRSDGFYLWGRVSSFADCAQIKPPASEQKFCLTTPPADRQPPGNIIWHAPQVHKLKGGPVSAANNRLLRDFDIRAIEAQPVGYAHAVADGIVMAVDPRRHPYPSAGTVSHYYFHLKPQVVPANRAWIPGGTAAHDAWAYGHASPSRVIEPFAVAIGGYQRVFFTYGPLYGAIMLAGLGGLVRFRRRPGRLVRIERRRRGATMLPWTTAVVLLVFPVAAADFDYRYMLPALPFACLAAGLALVRQPARDAGEPPSGALPAAVRATEAQPEFS